MRDLEIRGAGNMLGLQQHGHIEAVGYDLYVRFLNEVYHDVDTDTFDNSLIGSVKLSNEDTFFIEVYYLPTNAGTIFITEINVEWL